MTALVYPLPGEHFAGRFPALVADTQDDIEAALGAVRRVLMAAIGRTHLRPTHPIDRLLSVAQAAEILGVRPGRVYELVSAGTLPSVRVGRTIRIADDQLRMWIAKGGTDGVRQASPRKVAR